MGRLWYFFGELTYYLTTIFSDSGICLLCTLRTAEYTFWSHSLWLWYCWTVGFRCSLHLAEFPSWSHIMYLCNHGIVVFIGYAVCTVQSLLCELDFALIWYVCFVFYTQGLLNSEDRFCVFDTVACDIPTDSGICCVVFSSTVSLQKSHFWGAVGSAFGPVWEGIRCSLPPLVSHCPSCGWNSWCQHGVTGR